MRRCRRTTSTKSGSRLAAQTAASMADRPEHETDEPEPQAETERRSQRAVEDGDRPRRAAEQDRLGQRAMDGRGEVRRPARPSDQRPRRRRRRTTGRKLDAAKAIDEAEHDLDQPAEAARGVAEGQRQAGDDDDDHRDDLGDRAFDRLQDLLQRLLPTA